MNSPAEISSTTDMVTCATTSALRRTDAAADHRSDPDPSSVVARLGRVERSAGARPKSSPVASARPRLNASMRDS